MDGPISSRVYRRGSVKLRHHLIFWDSAFLELTSISLSAYKQEGDKEVEWTMRNCHCRVSRNSENIVVQSDQRVACFSAENNEENEKWYNALRLASSRDIRLFLQFDHLLGTGATSEVYRATVPGGNHSQQYAVKVMAKRSLDRLSLEHLRKEADIHRNLAHDNIVRLYDVFESRSRMYMVLELVTGGMLLDRLVSYEKFAEEHVRIVMKQIFQGVQYLHSVGVVHRDLKLDNVLCAEAREGGELRVKIADFGLSVAHDLSSDERKQEGDDDIADPNGATPNREPNNGNLLHMRSFVGTPVYMAPEITGRSTYGESVDAWALGVIMYSLLCGQFPFPVDGVDARSAKKKPIEFRKTSWTTVSADAKELIGSLMDLDSSRRISISAALSHPWFASSPEVDADDSQDLGVDFTKLREEESGLKKYVKMLMAANRMKLIGGFSPLTSGRENVNSSSGED